MILIQDVGSTSTEHGVVVGIKKKPCIDEGQNLRRKEEGIDGVNRIR